MGLGWNLVRWVLFGAYLALTILLSSMTRPPIAEAVSDTVLHALEFAAMATLLIQALGKGLFKRHTGRHLMITAAFGVLYGAADEVHQYFTPGRHSSVKDAAVDASATIAMVALFAVMGRFLGPRPASAPGSARGSDRSLQEPSEPPRVELLTREGCHLCEAAKGVLESALGPAGVGFEVVDVDADPVLAARHGDEVPVVLIDGIKRFKGRVDAGRLEGLLADRGRLRSRGAASPRGAATASGVEGRSEGAVADAALRTRRGPLPEA